MLAMLTRGGRAPCVSPMTPGWSLLAMTMIVPSAGPPPPRRQHDQARRRVFEDRALDPALPFASSFTETRAV
jgi:hypothetical protein